MTVHKALHPRYDVEMSHGSRKEGRRGIASIHDSVDVSMQRPENFIRKSWRRAITTRRNDTVSLLWIPFLSHVQNNRCGLCGDKNETINHIISNCSKLVEIQYKTGHGKIGKVIHSTTLGAISLNFTIRTNDLYTTQNSSQKKRGKKLSWKKTDSLF